MAPRLLADLVLVLHLGVVLFVVGGLAYVIAGNLLRWPGANHPLFRVAHLAAIGFVVVQSWLGQDCPLTVLEAWLRMQAGQGTHGQGFIEHWVQRLLFYQAPAWVFATAYTAFGALVAAAWWRFPPRRGGPAPGAA